MKKLTVGKMFRVLTALLLSSLLSIDAFAARFVVLAPDLTENMFAIGAGESVVGRVESADFPSEVTSIPVVGDFQSINAELILSLKPDYVLAWQGGNPERHLQYLEGLGLNVVRLSSQSILDLPEQLRLLGELSGQIEVANKRAVEFETELQGLSEGRKGRNLPIFYQIWHSPLMTINSSSWITEAITYCGGLNQFADRAEAVPQLTVESIIAANPKLIIAGSGADQSWVEFWKPWGMLDAVANNQLKIVEADYLHRLTMRTLLGMEQLCQTIDSAAEVYH
jgi:ABC-type Fe3+-hydroxamate transport system substrate-binding protein